MDFDKMIKHKFSYSWMLSDGFPAPGIDQHGMKAFGTFVCAGGSTMGYKLAGYNHIGGVEFASHYAKMYAQNLNPELMYVEDIRNFNTRQDLPDMLYDLDLLDGSPPCAAFSTSGARERLWGKSSDYEGRKQVKDDLVFVYADTIKKLMPKVFLLENVSGLIKGNAKGYLKKLVTFLSDRYSVQVFCLNSASMGVPQMRERVFVIGIQKRFNIKKLVLKFDEEPISFKNATYKYWNRGGESIEKYAIGKYYDEIDWPREVQHPKRFNLKRPRLNRPCNTLLETMSNPGLPSVVHPTKKRKLNKYEASVIQSYPLDYDFLDQPPLSCIGRSVPPVMMAQISHQIYLQWLSRI